MQIKGPVIITSDREIVDTDHWSTKSLKEALQTLAKYAALMEEKEAEQRKEDDAVSNKNGD